MFIISHGPDQEWFNTEEEAVDAARIMWQVFRKFIDGNFPGYVHRQNLGCYSSKKECEHAIYQYEAKYPDSFIDGEVQYY